jgi:hypothetical protein
VPPLKAAVGSFFTEFSKFERQSVSSALRSLSMDALFVEQAESLLEFDGRLKLLERLAFARGVPSAIMQELEGVFERARKLRELTVKLTSSSLLTIGVGEVEEYVAEAVALQSRLGAIAATLNSRQPATRLSQNRKN